MPHVFTSKGLNKGDVQVFPLYPSHALHQRSEAQQEVVVTSGGIRAEAVRKIHQPDAHGRALCVCHW